MQELSVTNTELKEKLAELKAVTLAKSKIEGELMVGKDIQMGMLPTAFPRGEDYDLHARLLPAKEVGGDFYDFFELSDGRLCFSVGDVSGKGVGAALFMAMAKTLLKSKARENVASPAEALSVVNAELSRDNSAFLFITLFTCFYDPETGQLPYTNAGHNPPSLKRDGELSLLNELHGPVVGIQEDAGYGFATVSLQEDDQLILFTDGVTEAMDVGSQLYGEERLERLVQTGSFASAQEIVDAIFDDVEEFTTGAEQAADITVLTVDL